MMKSNQPNWTIKCKRCDKEVGITDFYSVIEECNNKKCAIRRNKHHFERKATEMDIDLENHKPINTGKIQLYPENTVNVERHRWLLEIPYKYL